MKRTHPVGGSDVYGLRKVQRKGVLEFDGVRLGQDDIALAWDTGFETRAIVSARLHEKGHGVGGFTGRVIPSAGRVKAQK